jgi:hypothetical protein
MNDWYEKAALCGVQGTAAIHQITQLNAKHKCSLNRIQLSVEAAILTA